jgi:putative transposase
MPNRASCRLGLYLVTTNIRDRRCVLSTVQAGRTVPTDVGTLVVRALTTVVCQCQGVGLDAYVIMPDHVHIILRLGPANAVGLSRLVGRIKGLSARWINAHWNTMGIAVWQRGFHDHLLHNAAERARARLYLANNPRLWSR